MIFIAIDTCDQHCLLHARTPFNTKSVMKMMVSLNANGVGPKDKAKAMKLYLEQASWDVMLMDSDEHSAAEHTNSFEPSEG